MTIFCMGHLYGPGSGAGREAVMGTMMIGGSLWRLLGDRGVEGRGCDKVLWRGWEEAVATYRVVSQRCDTV